MAGNWDDEDSDVLTRLNGVTLPGTGDRWDGEDDDDIKDAWDAESSEEEPEGTGVVKKPKKTLEQKIKEREERKRQELAKRKEMEKELSEAEKRQIQEESDLMIAKETLGLNLGPSTGLDNYNPKDKPEFDQFRYALQDKLLSLKDSPYYVLFLEELVRELAVPLTSEDTKRLSNRLGTMSSEKAKKERELLNKGKRRGKGKAQLAGGKALDGGEALEYVGDDAEAELVTYGDEFDDFM